VLGTDKKSTSSLDSLLRSDGSFWIEWFGKACDHDPELARAIRCLATLEQARVEFDSTKNIDPLSTSQLIKPIFQFVGQARCPSSQACEKFAFRLKVLSGWFHTSLCLSSHQDSNWSIFVLGAFQQLLSRMYSVAEGADDRKSAFKGSLRQLTKDWLNMVAATDLEPVVKANWVFYSSMSDVTGVVPVQIWWPALKQCDEEIILFLIEQEINQMSELQPSMATGWKSYEKRWLRVRLKSLLSELKQWYLLSELLVKSSVDDVEAAQALECLQKAGRHRLAISQGEKWQRLLPGSAVLAEALFNVYLHDGWDEEAEQLLAAQYALNPDPKWLNLLKENFSKDSF
jgi:hypothetical protein